MDATVRYTQGLGNAAIYARVRQGAAFWNFTTNAWVGAESHPADTSVFLTETDDSDASDSRYSAALTPPVGTVVVEYVLAATFAVIAEETVTTEAAVVPPSAPPASAVSVAQMALAALGHTETVSSLSSPATKAERLAAIFYMPVLTALLSVHDWRWARRRAALEDVTATEGARPGWAHAYRLPGDCVRPVSIDPAFRGGPALSGVTFFDAATPAVSARARWVVEANNAADGRLLLCDAPEASLVYTALITDPALWDPMFLDAMTLALAARLAMPLTVKPELATAAAQFAGQSLRVAIAADANESLPDPQSQSEIITSRSW